MRKETKPSSGTRCVNAILSDMLLDQSIGIIATLLRKSTRLSLPQGFGAPPPCQSHVSSLVMLELGRPTLFPPFYSHL